MMVEFWAPTRASDRVVLQLEIDAPGWLGVRQGDELMYADNVGRYPGTEAERVRGIVVRREIDLTTQRLRFFLERQEHELAPPPAELAEPDPLPSCRSTLVKINPRRKSRRKPARG